MGGTGGYLIKLLSDLGQTRLLPPDRIDWPCFTALVKKHRLSPLFYYHLRQTNGEIIFPTPAWKNLEREYHLQLVLTVLKTNSLIDLLTIFQAEGIEVILLKGAHLAEAYYPHPALRPFDDVDLLIRPGQVGRARSLLKEMGYRLLEETATAQKFFLLPAQKQEGFLLELHTGLQTPHRKNPSFDIRISAFWDESAIFSYGGVPVRVLQPTRNLFYLACHLCHHGFSRLIWLYDLHLVTSKSAGEIDWDKLAAEARRSRSAGLVYYPLKFAREVLRSPIPEDLLVSLAPPLFKRPAGAVWLKAGRLEKGLPTAGVGGAALRFLLNDSWPEALKSYILH